MNGLIVGVAVPVGVISIILLFVVIYLKKKGCYADDEEELIGIATSSNIYTYAELQTATGNFSPSNKLGDGRFGAVYKGTLNNGKVVAVKQQSAISCPDKREFITEMATLSAVQHQNLVKLYGCCIEGSRRLLVYEYLENNNLDQALFGKKLHLSWPKRFVICFEIARGLAYLHEESRPKIILRDVNAKSILLDAELYPKISDFGLARFYDDKKTHIINPITGTIGYLAPEYAMEGHLTEKADVFGFGVVCLEVLSGRPNTDISLDDDKIYLLEWAWNLYESNRSMELVDPALTAFDERKAMRVIEVAFLCTQASPMQRPSMSRVVAMLAGDVEVSTAVTKPSCLTNRGFEDITSSSLDEEPPTLMPSLEIPSYTTPKQNH